MGWPLGHGSRRLQQEQLRWSLLPLPHLPAQRHWMQELQASSPVLHVS